MGKKTERMLRDAIAQMQAQIAQMQRPESNPAQQYLTNQALEGAEWMKKGDYSQLPKGMFFDFKTPVEETDRYKKLVNINQGGTFALGDGAGAGKAMKIQNQYLTDKFARDASQNYQDNVSNAGMKIRGGLEQAAGAKSGQDAAVISALQGLTSSLSSMPQKTPWWQTLLGQSGSIVGSILSKW